ncbi:MAG: twin-arginine translocase TatA/TatE family subunit [Gammaproteobacteria bacterium]|nr:twin-arginine translocase TatA/TatE family subunit [Gammaproteobacteria bacterium]
MGISVTKLLIVLAIIIVIFGTKRLKDVGGDLGEAIKSFKKAVKDEETPAKTDTVDKTDDN